MYIRALASQAQPDAKKLHPKSKRKEAGFLRLTRAVSLSLALSLALVSAPSFAAPSVGSAPIHSDGTVDLGFALAINESAQERLQNITLDSFNALPKSRISWMREAYEQAVAAFHNGDEALGLKIQYEKLQGYPLNVWLNYYYLSYNVRADKLPAVMSFIQSGQHHELAALLKERYAKFLSDEHDYEALAQLLGPKSIDESKRSSLTTAQKKELCRFYEANWALNRVNESAISFASRIYLELGNRPQECGPLLALFDAKGYLSDKLILKRYESAYVERYYQETTQSLARELARTPFSARVRLLQKLYDDPSQLFAEVLTNDATDHRVAVLAFMRYANMSPEAARADLKRFITLFRPSSTELIGIYQLFAQNFLGRSYGLNDVNWVDRTLPALAWNDELKEMRLRRAIYFAKWDKVYVLIDHLAPETRTAINWRYWKGRAAKELGFTDEAQNLLTSVAQDRSFFGFYAAQTMGLDYAWNHARLEPEYSFPLDIAHNKSALRFFELFALEDANAIYEWHELIKHSPKHEAMVMAQWALQTGNIKYAIDYVITSGNWDALDYRFPIAFRDYFEHYADENYVDLSFLYGIARQESMLNPKVRSWAGAVGLMQVMPGTARDIARKEEWRYRGSGSLTDPETNIRYGSTYIRWMLERFDYNRILAAAAYNAGPMRIPQWISTDGQRRDAAMFIESIPFAETRKYVQNVLLYDAIYNYLLTGRKGDLLKPSEFSYAY